MKSFSGLDYGFFDLLFTPNRRRRFMESGEGGRENARAVAVELMPVIRRAARKPRLAAYRERPSPQITIEREPGSREPSRVIISFHEDEGGLMWSISDC